MKRTRVFSLLVVVALLLGMSGVVSAQEPEFFTIFSYTPTTLYVGNIVQMSLSGFFGSSGAGECLEIIVDTSWTNGGTLAPVIMGSPTNFPAGPMAAGNCGTAMPVPGNPNGDSRFFVNATGTGGFEVLSIWFPNLPAGSVGSGYTIRAISAIGVVGASYIDASPGGAGGITVNAAATTRYVANNSTQCQGYTPCDTGTGGLAAALGDATATDIVVLGAYNADPSTSHILAGGDDLRGEGGASIHINGACQSANAFLRVTGSGSTISDLTFDGTCASSNPTAGISVEAASTTIQDVTVKDFANVGVLVSGSGGLTNDGVTYDNNGTGASVPSGTATFDNDTFTDNTTGVAVNGGTATVTNSSFDGNTTGVNHTSGTANIGTTDGDGNAFDVPAGGTGISSVGGAGGAIQDNTITGGSYGIYLTAAGTNVYANTVSDATTQQIACGLGGGFAGAGFNYIGGNIGGGGTNCSDGTDQLGSPIVAWTDSALTLNECTIAGSGPIFDLGNSAPYGYAPPLGRDSRYYATTSGATGVTISGSGGNQFKMLMAGTGCNPMTYACWEDSSTRAQSGAGYYFYGTQDPTALTLANVTTESPNVWLPVVMAVVVLAGVGGALLLLRRRQRV
jgi:parallel beta-helix repeat protein